MPNFISIRIFKRFFKDNLNSIINSFQIKHFYLKKMAEYRRNLRGILAKNGPARPEEILSLNGPARPGPAKIQARPARPGPVHLNLRAGTAWPGPARFIKPEIYNPVRQTKIEHIFN